MNKKYVTALALTALVATSLFGAQAFAETQSTKQEAPQTTTPQPERGLEGRLGGMMRKDQGQRGMFGTVASVTGTTFTMTVKARPERDEKSKTPVAVPADTTYTVDATNASIIKANKKGSLSDIVVGDTVVVMGKTSGATITATRVMDGLPKMGEGKKDQRPDDTKPTFVGNGMPVVAGKITAITGNSVTLTNRENVTYTVDVTNAKVEQKGVATTVSALAVGDMAIAQGTVNGTTVTATSIIDQGVAPTPKQADETPQSPEKKGFFGKIGAFFGRFF